MTYQDIKSKIQQRIDSRRSDCDYTSGERNALEWVLDELENESQLGDNIYVIWDTIAECLLSAREEQGGIMCFTTEADAQHYAIFIYGDSTNRYEVRIYNDKRRYHIRH